MPRRPLSEAQKAEVNHILVGGLISIAGVIATVGAQLIVAINDQGNQNQKNLPVRQAQRLRGSSRRPKKLTGRKAKKKKTKKHAKPKVALKAPVAPPTPPRLISQALDGLIPE